MPIGSRLRIKIPGGIGVRDESNQDVLLSVGRLNPLNEGINIDKSQMENSTILLTGLV